jgi:hypothetical protein
MTWKKKSSSKKTYAKGFQFMVSIFSNNDEVLVWLFHDGMMCPGFSLAASFGHRRSLQ